MSHVIDIYLSRSTAGAPPLSEAEVATLITLVREVAERNGLHANPDFARVKKSSEESPEYERRIVADFVSDWKYRPSVDRVIVAVGVHKVTGQGDVLIHNVSSMSATTLTSTIETEIVEALAEKMPSRAIEVERQMVGPNLAP